jgi:hypothetical protein
MSEIVNDPVYRPVITCFLGAESRNLSHLLLISLPRVRERYQRILWIISLLFRCSGLQESRNSAGFGYVPAVFSGKTAKNIGAAVFQ